jgi:transcriptional regulator with XRE-family HTH domain
MIILVFMTRGVILDSDDRRYLADLGKRIKLARLRRNMSQADMAERAGVTRLTYQRIEAGGETSSLALLTRVLAIFGYPERLAEVLESDSIGEDLELVHGRRHSRRTSDVADF